MVCFSFKRKRACRVEEFGDDGDWKLGNAYSTNQQPQYATKGEIEESFLTGSAICCTSRRLARW